MVLKGFVYTFTVDVYGINKPFTGIKNMAEKGKIVVKKWDFRG